MEKEKKVINLVKNLRTKSMSSNKYVIITSIIFLFQFMCCEFFIETFDYLERWPFIRLNGNTIKLNYEICQSNNFTSNDIELRLDDSKKTSSILNDFELFCNRKKISLIGVFIFLGMMIGGMTTYLIADKIGRKKTLKIIIPIYIITLIGWYFVKGEKVFWLFLLIEFINGFLSYIIIITILIYMCEIIENNLYIYLAIIISGIPISGILCDIFFYKVFNNWRYILFVFAGINLIDYLIMMFYITDSPIFHLNNREFDIFQESLKEIGKKNNIEFNENDFLELKRFYIKKILSLNEEDNFEKQKEKYLEGFDKKPKENFYDENSDDEEKNLLNENNNNEINNKDEKVIQTPKVKKTVTILLNEKENKLKRKSTFDRKDYLIFKNNNESEIIKNFFLGYFRYTDYTPLDLIRYKSQIANFFILSFLWCVSIIIKDGLAINNKNFSISEHLFIYDLIGFILELCGYFLVVFLISIKIIGIQRTQIMFQLFSVILLTVSLFNDNGYINKNFLTLLYLSKLCYSSLFFILYLITIEIYPTLIKTKGLGWNKAMGRLGGLLSPIMVEYLKLNALICWFIVFGFFGLVFTYGLPNKIGDLVLNDNKEKGIEKKKTELEEMEEIFKNKKNKKFINFQDIDEIKEEKEDENNNIIDNNIKKDDINKNEDINQNEDINKNNEIDKNDEIDKKEDQNEDIKNEEMKQNEEIKNDDTFQNLTVADEKESKSEIDNKIKKHI